MQEIELKGLNEKIYYGTCDNGLPVYMWVNDKVNSVYMTLSVKYGSIDTEFKVKNKTYKVPNGIAHFLEHVKFNEKGGKTANDFFDKLGSDINAFTTFEYTNYQVYSTSHFKDNLDHLLDYVMTPYFTKKLIAKEKGIIIEEAKSGEDNPYNKLYYGMYKDLFHKSKYRNTIVGEIEDIKNIDVDDINLIFDTFYHPKNMMLVITGNFNPYEAMQIVKDNQKNKDFGEYKNPIVIKEKEKESVLTPIEEVRYNVEIPKIKIALKIPRKNFTEKDDRKLLIMLSIILGSNFGDTSDFREELFEKELVTDIWAGRRLIEDYIIITVNIESKYPDEIIKIINDKLEKLELSEELFKRRIKADIATLVLNFDSISAINENIQDDLIIYNKICADIKEIFESITFKENKKVLNEISTKNKSTIIMLPKEKEE